MLKTLSLALCLMLLAGCAESLHHFHEGDLIIQRHIIPPSWHGGGKVKWVQCWPEALVWSVYWNKKVCPSEIDRHATIGVPLALDSVPSYAEMVVPQAWSAVIGAAVGTGLARQQAGRMTQSVTGSPINASTVLIR